MEKKLNNKGFADDGILSLMDNLLKDKNPNGLSGISFCTISMKRGLASQFNLSGNKKMTALLIEADKKYPEVKKFLISIMSND